MTTSYQHGKLVGMNHKQVIPANSESGAAAVTQMAMAVFRLNGALLRWGDQIVASLGLTSARWQILGAIALADAPLAAPQVSDAMGVTRQGAQKQLNLLLNQGLVEAQSNTANRRSPLFALTPQGLALYREAEALWSAYADQLSVLIPAAQARAATQALASMLSTLQPVTRPTRIES